MSRHSVIMRTFMMIEHARQFGQMAAWATLTILLSAPGPAWATPAPALERVQDGLEMLANLVPGRDGSGWLFALEQFTGRVRIIEHGRLLDADFLDIGDRLIADALSDEGLLGLALPPDDAAQVYATYVGQHGDLVLSRFETRPDGRVALPGSEQVLLRIARDDRLHHCGHIQFGPHDGLLYLCVGDTQSDPLLNQVSQDPDSLLGKIIRIDPRALAPSGEKPHRGALAAMAAVPMAQPEIWLTGLRNPWRFSFDPESGDLFLPDVGRFHWEELNIVPAETAGANHGWPLAEGYECLIDCARRDDLAWPVFGYAHDGRRCAIVGGAHLPAGTLRSRTGSYVFGDFCSGEVWQVRRGDNGALVRRLALTGLNPVAITRGPDGDVLIADGPQGAIWRLVLPEDGPPWQPAEALMAAQAFEALRNGNTFTRELLEKERRDRQSMRMSMRWQMSEPLVRFYDALGRPFD